jgi:membrane-bound lytic murein transglycosylase B
MHTQKLSFFHLFITSLLLVISLSACAAIPATQPHIYDDFIERMVSKHQFDGNKLRTLLNGTVLKENILKAISSPAEKRLEWHSYRKIFLKANRINAGVKFWQENKQLLEGAEKQYGVPAEIIVAIIGVETRYGANTGSYKVLDALTTIGFHFPKRAKFFKGQLEHFLLLCREEGLDPTKLKGSYAGAMGKSQFISSSYRAYAVDGDNDGQRDLWHSNADIIFSIANYFARHGWSNDHLIAQKTSVIDDKYKAIFHSSLKLKHTLQDLKDRGVNIPENMDSKTAVKLLELKQADHSEFWLAFKNFYVITRYNHSHLYAMAAYQLSQEIKNGYQKSS